VGTLVSIDGAPLVAPGELGAPLLALDRGLLHGDGVFEVFRTYDGAPFRLADHLSRLARGCSVARIDLPWSLDALAAEVRSALAAAGHTESHVRLVVTRGRGGGGPRIRGDERARRLLIVSPLRLPSEAEYARGLSVALVVAAAPMDAMGLAGTKTLSYLRQALALEVARGRGAEDALLLNDRGDVLEGATSNVVVVRGGALRSPPASAGVLPGITWDTVAGLARAEGMAVEARMLAPRDVYDADELMLLSSVRGVMPVVAADGAPIATGVPGPVTIRLRAQLAAHAMTVAQRDRVG
jgi:branched-chain amino acid aminotransferase